MIASPVLDGGGGGSHDGVIAADTLFSVAGTWTFLGHGLINPERFLTEPAAGLDRLGRPPSSVSPHAQHHAAVLVLGSR